MACARVLTRPAAQLAASQVLARYGVGPHTAATLLLTPVDNPDRLRSEAALAALCGASPLQASLGRTCRHRLNRGGDRPANNALWAIALTRMRSDVRTQDVRPEADARGPCHSRNTVLFEALHRPRNLPSAPADLAAVRVTP